MGKAPNVRDNSLQVEQMRIADAQRQREQAEALRTSEFAALTQDPNAAVTSQEAIARQQTLQRQQQEREARDRYTGAREGAINTARSTATNELTRRGLDPSRYGGSLNAEIDRIAGSIPDLDPNPGNYFDPAFVGRVLGGEETAARDRNTRSVRDQFGTGFERNAVTDTADDAFLDSILDQQFGEARGTLDRARARGDLNDVGYNAATSELDRGRTTGRTTLSGIGDTVLGRYRDELAGIGTNASNAASGWNLGDADFSVNPFTDQFNQARTRQQGSLEGDVRGAVGSTQLFNVGDILSRGAKVQGPTSGDPNDFVSSVLNRRRSNTDRGVGSGGVF